MAKGVNSAKVQKTLKDNNVKSRAELYNLYASRVGCVYLGDENVGSQDLTNWECSKGHHWKAKPNSIQQGHGCPYCNSDDIKYVLLRNNCKTVDEYGQKIAAENPNNIKYIGGFINDYTKVEWECGKGHRWKAIPKSIKTDRSCPYCKSDRMEYVLLRNNCKTLDEYGHKLAKENPNDIKYVGGFTNTTTKAEWECNQNHSWETTPHTIQQGRGCPYCKGRNDMKYVLFKNNCKTPDEYGHKIAAENPNGIKYIEGLVSATKKAEWECNRSNHRWKARPGSIKQGHGCPKCAKRISKKEQALFLEIQKVYPEAINNTRKLLKNHRYELDVFIPGLNKAIEFDGAFWHGSQFPDAVRRDTDKDTQCTEAGIALYRVKESDWDTDKDVVIKNVLEFLKT